MKASHFSRYDQITECNRESVWSSKKKRKKRKRKKKKQVMFYIKSM